VTEAPNALQATKASPANNTLKVHLSIETSFSSMIVMRAELIGGILQL
jgi:hypothetical protein